MNFEGQNQNYSKEEKEKIDQKTKIIKDLVAFSVKYNNPISFIDFGLDENSELVKNNEINPKIIEGLDKENIETIKSILESLKSFLKRPLFTDSMPDDLQKREQWWKDNKDGLDTETQEFYENNRIRLGKNYGILGSLSYLPDLMKNSEIKEKLLDLNKDIPFELLKDDSEGDRIYVKLNNQRKIEVVEKFTEVIQRTISILEK